MRTLLLSVLVLCGCISAFAQDKGFYHNPILSGFYPDPSICRVGEDYYLINSTFSYFPGLPIFHSKDLVNWKLIGHVITREEQMDFSGRGVSRSLFAPTIRYHDGLFYVTCTMVGGGGNFVVTAKDPAGPWSNPTWLPVDGIDPSLFFDDDGKCYITYNSIPPDNKSLYDGHRTIRMNEFDYKTGKVLGENKILVNGGTDISKKPSWIEGPHIVKKYGHYYLISAEGGTGADHSVVAFRSKNIWGPYESYEKNPILTQRHLTGRPNPITSTGHADLVELPDGRWYTVFLGTRPYTEDYFSTGRETFLTPVVWENEWPVINPGLEEVQYRYPLPFPSKPLKAEGNIYSGNFSYKEEFDDEQLSGDWLFLRTVKENWHSLSEKKGHLAIKLRPETAGGTMNPSLVARRQQHTNFTATTSLQFMPQGEKEKAGLLCFIHEGFFYYLAVASEGGKPVIQLIQSSGNSKDSVTTTMLASQPLPTKGAPVQLRVEGKADQYAFYYSTNNRDWKLLKDQVDGRFITTKRAGGFGGNFVGVTIGLYASSYGMHSRNTAYYDWFHYQGKDPVHESSHHD